MKKEFDKWNTQKKDINTIEKRPFFHEREIWFCHLGTNVGFEQDGRGELFLRPVIVFRKFNNQVFWAIPLTTTRKSNKYYFQFSFDTKEISVAILSQVRLMDAQRLSHKVGMISETDFMLMTKNFTALLP